MAGQDLAGRTALVTGPTGGIGEATAQQLAEHGRVIAAFTTRPSIPSPRAAPRTTPAPQQDRRSPGKSAAAASTGRRPARDARASRSSAGCAGRRRRSRGGRTRRVLPAQPSRALELGRCGDHATLQRAGTTPLDGRPRRRLESPAPGSTASAQLPPRPTSTAAPPTSTSAASCGSWRTRPAARSRRAICSCTAPPSTRSSKCARTCRVHPLRPSSSGWLSTRQPWRHHLLAVGPPPGRHGHGC
jgi:hypothetical protein